MPRATLLLLVGAGLVLQPAIPLGAAALAQQPPKVLSAYKSMQGPSGRLRNGAHPAIDFDGRIGDPVLAAADGVVSYAASSQLCGNGVWIQHGATGPFTLYCHLDKMQTSLGDRVTRGQVIGTLGVTGEPMMRAVHLAIPIPQLHFALQSVQAARNDGQLDNTLDPLSVMQGCFDPAKTYPTDRLILTYPLRCK